MSMCATFYPMTAVASDAGNPTASEGVSLAILIGSLCVIAIGFSGALVGYLQIVHDYSNVFMTAWMLLIVQTAWILYLSEMVSIGKDAAKGYPMFHVNTNDSDVWFYGAMGILGVFAYGFCLYGSIALLSMLLYAYQVGRPGCHARGYYRFPLCIFSFMVFVAGLAQLMLGAHTLAKISKGPIDQIMTPDVAMFTVTYPEISVTVGLVYLLNGLWGMVRASSNPTDDYFPMSLGFQWVLTVTMMILTQISYLPYATMADATTTRGCLMLAAHVMPAFLDYKARLTPEVLSDDYYGLNSGAASEKHLDQEDPVVENDDENDDEESDVKIGEEQPRGAAPADEDDEVTA